MSGFLWFYFGTNGRLTRRQWWLGGLLLFVLSLLLAGVALAAVGVTLDDVSASLNAGPAGKALAASLRRDIDIIGAGDAVLFFLPWVCLSVKRRHDRGRSGRDYLVFAGLGLALTAVRLVPYIPGVRLPAAFDVDLQPADLVIALLGLYLLLVLGIRGTVRGANRYGPDPAALRAAFSAGALADVASLVGPVLDARQHGQPASNPMAPAPSAGNPISRYWRGLYPLGPSYWLVNGLVGILVEAGFVGFLRVFDPDGTVDPVPGFFGIGGAGLFVAVMMIWLRVGTFRSAQRRARARHAAGRRAFWPRLAQVMIGPPLLLDAGMLYFVGLLLVTFFPMAFANDPALPNYAVRALPGGTSVEIEGGIKYGLSGALEAALDAHPGVRTIVLESPGGRLGASEQVAALVSVKGLDTYVATHCESACTRIFVAGRNRVLREGARLGFHSGRTDLYLPAAVVAAMNQTFAARYVAAGIDADFMARVEAVAPTNIWYPSDAELLAAHVVTRIDPLPATPAKIPPVPPSADVAAGLNLSAGHEAVHGTGTKTHGK